MELEILNTIALLVGLVTATLTGGAYVWRLHTDVKQVKDKLNEVSALADDELSTVKLRSDERTLLDALVAESHGIGDGVAVYPFESRIRALGFEGRSSVLISALQDHGFVVLEEDTGYNRIEDRESKYPVYRVTARGFRWKRLATN